MSVPCIAGLDGSAKIHVGKVPLTRLRSPRRGVPIL